MSNNIEILSRARDTESRIKIFSEIDYKSITQRENLDICVIATSDIKFWEYLLSIGFELTMLPSKELINTNNLKFIKKVIKSEPDFANDVSLIEECVAGNYSETHQIKDVVNMFKLLHKLNVIYDLDWIFGNSNENLRPHIIKILFFENTKHKLSDFRAEIACYLQKILELESWDDLDKDKMYFSTLDYDNQILKATGQIKVSVYDTDDIDDHAIYQKTKNKFIDNISSHANKLKISMTSFPNYIGGNNFTVSFNNLTYEEKEDNENTIFYAVIEITINSK